MPDIPNGLLQTSSIWFQDDTGRTLLLRGVNLSGSVKCPHGHPQHQADDFWASAEDGAELTWVNNPLNLDDGSADVHLARLRAWGWNTLRFVFTWEAIEHAGPKRYDTDYIAYVVAVLRRCGEFGFRVFMDPHQDVWSRFSGGSGAPIWTFHAANLQPRNFPTTYSALLQPFYIDPTLPADTKPDAAQFPAMIWSTNHDRLANLTMWTLFFGGRDFAPQCIIDGINIQDWLHAHYLGAIDALAAAIASADSGNLLDRVVIGWDSLNEPAEGLIGRQNLSEVDHSEGKMHKGPTTSPLQEFNLGMGRRVNQAEYWVVGSLGPSQKGKVDLDPNGTKVWMEEEEDDALSKKWGYTRGSGWKKGLCIWAQHGVWDLDTSAITKPDYFRTNPTRDVGVDFEADYWLPHFTDYLKRVRRHHARAIAFIQPPVFHVPPPIPADLLQGRACYAPHFYDGLTLITRHWWWFNADPVGLLRNKYATLAQAISLGEGRVRRSLAGSLRQLKDDVNRFGSENKMPTLIGEIGIPFDLDDRKAYGFCEGGIGQGDYTNQQRALDASLSATDNTNILNWTMWTYCPDNSHEYGDQWNMEDLSVWSTDDLISERSPSEDSTDRSFCGSTASSTATSFQQLGEQRTVSSPTGKPAVASSASSADCQRYVNRVSPEIVRQGSRIPPELLIDGTRAVGAFCRPYAVATVGRPTNMTFDIRTSQFKLEVEVDSASVHGPQVYTEIFVPYVHYAKDGNRMSLDAASSRSTSGPIHAKVKHDVNKSLSDGIIEPLSLDISVSVSDGTYETHGQYLRWWYDVPTSTSASARTYTIVIARNGGPIPARMEQSIPSWSDLCPIGQSSCNVM